MTQPTHPPTDPLTRIFAYRAIDLRDRFPQPLETFREALECLQSDRAYMADLSGEITAYLHGGYSLTIPDEFFIHHSSEIDAALVRPEENDAVCAEIEAWLRATLTSGEVDVTEAVPLEKRPYSLNRLLEQCHPQVLKQSEDLRIWQDKPDVSDENIENLDEKYVRATADRVFGNKIKAERWMTKPYRQLDGRSPEEVIFEDPQQIYELLLQIEHGFFV